MGSGCVGWRVLLSMGAWLQRQFWFHDVIVEFHLVQSNNFNQSLCKQNVLPFGSMWLEQPVRCSGMEEWGTAANLHNTHTHTHKTRWHLAFFSEHNAVLMRVSLSPIGDRRNYITSIPSWVPLPSVCVCVFVCGGRGSRYGPHTCVTNVAICINVQHIFSIVWRHTQAHEGHIYRMSFFITDYVLIAEMIHFPVIAKFRNEWKIPFSALKNKVMLSNVLTQT